ncbi:MAG: 6-pyruvoyltetrahydropterin/6-carboxytetrahydropterin synthase [Granulosicoccus sp.]|jgi:6-pyruvoyltetrahydropterin/6-carboxytetrahydropterin synthase
MAVTVKRKAHFNAAHRLFRKDWSDERNLEVFGKCSYPNYHGHNYEVEVSVTGPIDVDTGFVIDLNDLKKIIVDQVEEPFDHRNFNLDVPEFADLNPTAENIAISIYNRLRPHIKSELDLSIELHETARNIVTYSG